MRTTLAATAVVAVALALGGTSLVLLLRRSQTSSVESAAKLRAGEIAGLAKAGRLPNPIPAKADDSSLVQVVDTAGHIVATSENVVGEGRLSSVAPKGWAPTVTTLHDLPIGDAGASYRVVALRVGTPDGTRLVYVAASLSGVDENLRQVSAILGGGLPVFLVLVGVVTWVLVGRAFHPVERIRTEVAELSARDLSRRVPVPPTHDEVGRLATTMNAMLERLERATDRERAFVGDASHELRSPIAALRAQLEVARHNAARDSAWTAADEEMLDEVLRMERLIDNLLLLARSDADAGALRGRAVLDFDDVVFAEIARAGESSTTPVHVTRFEPARVRGDRTAVGMAVRNLLENAQRHASTSAFVELSTAAGSVELVVADDGPGIPVEHRQHVFERFTRLDGARDRDRGGAGLGLAITRDVVRGHGGDVVAVERVGGGAKFVVTLPSADGPPAGTR